MTAPLAATAAAPRTWPRALAGAAALWALLDALVLFGTFPYWPRTATRWALLLAGGPALYLSLAGMVELAILPRLRSAVEAVGAPRWAARALPALAVAATVAVAAWWTLRVEGRP